MGEIAEWIMEGGACQYCGEMLGNGAGPGYPQTCAYCAQSGADDDPPTQQKTTRRPRRKRKGA